MYPPFNTTLTPSPHRSFYLKNRSTYMGHVVGSGGRSQRMAEYICLDGSQSGGNAPGASKPTAAVMTRSNRLLGCVLSRAVRLAACSSVGPVVSPPATGRR